MSTPKPLRNTQYALHITFYAFLLLLPLLAASQLWGPGMVNTRGGGDSPFLLQRTLDMAEALRHGHIPPLWMAHAAYDLGYPFFNHYAALPFYLSGGLTALGFSPILAIQATQTLGFILAALTMALWAQRVYRSRWAVLLTVAAYTFAPFHLVNVYTRGDSLSEFYAFVWYPLILWTLARAAERLTAGRFIFAALSYAALILTHNVSALIFAPFALLYAASQQEGESAERREGEELNPEFPIRNLQSKMQNLKSAILPFLLAFLLTAWFWIPAIGETGYGQMGPEFTAGYFHFTNHFRGLNLVQPSFFFNYAVAGNANEAGPFAMGLIQATLVFLGASVLVWKISRSATQQVSGLKSKIQNLKSEVFILFGLLLATFMITPLSTVLWEHLPLLATTQFPWRFLSVQALFTAIATGALANQHSTSLQIADSKFRNLKSKIHPPIYGCVCILIALSALGNLHPERLLITTEDVTWDNLLLYEAFTGNIGTTIRYEYLPRDVKPRLYISEAVVGGVNAAQPIADGNVALTATLLSRAPQQQVWRIALDDAAPVVFPLHWWPGWQAKVDGDPADTYPFTGSGRLAVDLAAGEHTLTLRLRNTPLRAAAMTVTALTLAGLLVVVIRRRGAKMQRRGAFSFLPLLILSCALGLSVLLPVIASQQTLPTSPQTFDFVQSPFPTRGPVHFGTSWRAQLGTGDAVLMAIDPLPETVAPGQTLTIPMTWNLSTPKPITATLRLVSLAEPRHGVTYGLAETSIPVSPQLLAALSLPPDLSRGLYLLELRVFDIEGELPARAPTGAGRGPLYIGAVRVEYGPSLPKNAATLAKFRDLTLHAIQAQQSDPATLQLKMAWSTPGTPRNWSLSLRLLDAEGRQLLQEDLQPGYGYLPTTLWRPGELITDFPVLTMPEGLAPGAYTLRVITYLEATMETGSAADFPITLTSVTLRDPHDSCCGLAQRESQTLCQGGGVSLTGLQLPEAQPEGAPLDFIAEWSVTAPPTADLSARWEVIDTAGKPVALREGPLAPGSHTVTWPHLAWVRAPVTLALPSQLPNSPYRLRLTLLEGDTILQSCELTTLAIASRPRSFALPAPSHLQQADFGGELRLLGYDMAQEADALTLTLWWQALREPSQDYKRFIHLLDPATGAVPAQDDAMPRAWTYPTTWWAAGEVVSETVTLVLGPVPTGTYRLGVGWYAEDTGIILPATDATGAAWADNRVILNDVTVHK